MRAASLPFLVGLLVWSIARGARHEARYRYVVYDGEPNVDLIERLRNDSAHPPVVTVEYE